MSIPVVSVVMVICDVERFLAEAIESILAQTFTHFEFIIVDFGSTDQSKTIALRYTARDERIKFHEIPKCGLAEARNAGCFLARGRYVAIMDADDISVPDRLMWQVDFMEHHPEVGLLGGAIEWIDATGNSLRIEGFPVEDHEIQGAIANNCPFCQPTVLIRRNAFISVGGYRPVFALAEDYDLWLRMAERFHCANVPDVVLKYRSHPGQIQLRKVKQQSLYSLAAQASAAVRKRGRPDPLDSVREITPDVLSSIGVEEKAQEIRADRDSIRAMYLAGQTSSTIEAVSQALKSAHWQNAESWQIAELWFTVARVHWKQRHLGSSLLSASRAFITRPNIVGRPFKPLLRKLGLARQ